MARLFALLLTVTLLVAVVFLAPILIAAFMLLGASAWLVSRIFGLPAGLSKSRRFVRPSATVFRWQQSAGPFARPSSAESDADVDGEIVETTWVREPTPPKDPPKDLIE